MTTITPTKVIFEHILVPTDFSDISRRAVEYAKAIAKQANSEIFLVHVNQPVSAIAPPEAAWIDESEILERQQEQMEQSGAGLRAEGFRAEAISVSGALRDEILAVAKQHDADLIVLGTHGKHGFERFLLGSDAEALLRHAPCPVLSIGPEVPAPPAAVWHPREVLCATTLDPASAGIAAYAYTLARNYEAHFVLFHVDTGQSQKADWKTFEEALRQHIPEGLDPQAISKTWLTRTKPGASIVDLAKNLGSDLIVMGAHTASWIATHLPPRTTARVLAETPCPVMTLQQP